jgi:hypothetical protein
MCGRPLRLPVGHERAARRVGEEQPQLVAVFGRECIGAHAYDRAFAIALTWSVATAALSTVLALRVAATAPPAAHDAAGADTVRPAMAVDKQQLEVAQRAA